jgi:class 3 adenylate cyclase/AmiR/NasT family two-component response regulator
MTRILVVDDEEDLESLIRQKFRQQIREQKYVFDFAYNGVQALKKLDDQNDIDLILSDINMPEMDGLTLLDKVGERYPLLKTVMVSAYGDMDNLRSAMNRGAFDFVVKPINFPDLETTIEKTIKYVNQTKDTIHAIKENNILKMYVDHSVLQYMTTHEFESSVQKNEMINATVTFIDICGFTSISERETPDNIINLLNKLFDVMVTEIIQEGGIVDKFIGDCVMAIFKGDFHLDKAIEACIKIRDKVMQLPDEKGFTPKVSIGINSGEMVYGNIGSPSYKRLDFTVIGDVVNTAQRLQSVAGYNEIIINAQCYEVVKHSFECESIGEVTLKNKSNPELLYRVKN